MKQCPTGQNHWSLLHGRSIGEERHGIKKIHGKPLDNYWIVMFPNDRPQHLIEQVLIENWSEEDFYRKTLLYKLMVKNLFEAHNIPYLTTEYGNFTDGTKETTEAKAKVQNVFSHMCTEAEKSPFIMDPFYQLTYGYPKLPCEHDGPEAQVMLSKYVLDKIDSIYGKVTKLECKITTLAEFRSKHEAYLMDKYPDWL